MENSLDRFSESLKLLQPLKIDERQNLFASTSAIGTSDSLANNSCSTLADNVQNAIDHWTGKRAIDYAPTISAAPKRNAATAAAINIVTPSAKLVTAPAPIPAVVRALPLAMTTPANIAPQALAITGIKSSYEVNSTLAIDSGLVSDSNGWKDLSKVDFWLTDAQSKRIELADASIFTTKDLNSAKFAYSTNLTGIVAGNYKLNAVAFDKAGAKSNTFSQSIVVKSVNLAPKSLAITGVKSSYGVNSTLSIDSGLVSDANGWQDLNKVDFWLTDAQGKRVELADATTFTTKDPNSAKFIYSTNLTGIVAGKYSLNAVAFDRTGAASNKFSQSISIEPINEAPKSLAITGIKSSYELNSTLAIDSGLVSDNNGWQDLNKVDFWLTDAQGKRVELADANTFTTKDPNSAKFAYSTSLTGIAAGEYKLNAIAYDKANLASNLVTQSLVIKPVIVTPVVITPKADNIKPQGLALEGIKSRYDPNATLAIDFGYVLDGNGWKDISKVDFWLTNSQGQRFELPDVNKFEYNAEHWAQFQYSTSLKGIPNGDYKLNAITYDKSGAASDLFTQSFKIDTIVRPALDLKLADPFNAFSVQQKQAFDIAVNNWKRIITNDKDTSGIFNIVVISSTKDLNGNSYLGTATAGEAYTDSVINSRSNISNAQVLAAGPVDINGVDYHNRINLNYYYLQDKPSTADLVVTLMHEIGHALGLEHESDESLMGPVHLQDRPSTLSSSSFAGLEKLGYVVDRNAQIKWA